VGENVKELNNYLMLEFIVRYLVREFDKDLQFVFTVLYTSSCQTLNAAGSIMYTI